MNEQTSKRSRGSRFSGGHWLVMLVGLLAVVMNFAALQDRTELLSVALLAQDIAVGSTISANDLIAVETGLGSPHSDGMISGGEISAVLGMVATRSLHSGEFAYATDFRNAAAPSALRAFAIPIEPVSAVGGAVAVTDRIDVIQAFEGVARYLALNLEVIAIPAVDDRGIGTSGFHVTVAIDAETALILAKALDEGGVSLVRSTGASPTSLSLVVGGENESDV